MKILAVSDKVVSWIYSPRICNIFTGIDLAIGCGDLPLEYLEFINSALDIPVYYVHGNHSLPDRNPEWSTADFRGSVDLHGKLIRHMGLTFAGVEGSLNYNNGIFQYSQFQMWLFAIGLVPALFLNHLKSGRFLDILVTHAPPWGIHDQDDLTHQGIKAFRWLITRFQPAYHLHGHIHVYRPDTVTETQVGRTRVVNAFGYKQFEL